MNPQDVVWTMAGVTALVTFSCAFVIMFWDLFTVTWGRLTGRDVQGTVSSWIVAKVGPLSPVTVWVNGAAVSHLFWYMHPAQCPSNTIERLGYALCGGVIAWFSMKLIERLKLHL